MASPRDWRTHPLCNFHSQKAGAVMDEDIDGDVRCIGERKGFDVVDANLHRFRRVWHLATPPPLGPIAPLLSLSIR